MINVENRYVLTALGYALLGLMLGIYMAASHNHAQMVTHAHILLLGFVVSFVYAAIYKLWIADTAGGLVKIQFFAHQSGIVLMGGGLFMLYGGLIAPATIEPVLAVGSLAILTGMVIMKIVFIRATRSVPSRRDPLAGHAVT
jgi:hypothetical protein